MGIRTPDLYVANVSRYQLCYIPVMVGTNGLEPSTSCMSSKRSNQLSYAPEGGKLLLPHKSFVL